MKNDIITRKRKYEDLELSSFDDKLTQSQYTRTFTKQQKIGMFVLFVLVAIGFVLSARYETWLITNNLI